MHVPVVRHEEHGMIVRTALPCRASKPVGNK